MMQEKIYDPRVREREKQLSREEDERDLAEGRISPENLQRRNGFIPGDIARSAKIKSWREFV